MDPSRIVCGVDLTVAKLIEPPVPARGKKIYARRTGTVCPLEPMRLVSETLFYVLLTGHYDSSSTEPA